MTTENTNTELSIVQEQQLAIYVPDERKVYNEIIVSDIKALPAENTYKNILVARFSENPIRDLDANLSGTKIKESINRIVFESGLSEEKIKEINLPEIMKIVIEDIFIDYRHLTISEVQYAFRKGIRGDFGDFFGINVTTFNNWLKAYDKKLRIKAFEYLKNNIKKESQPVSEHRKTLSHLKWLKSYMDDFEQYKESKTTKMLDVGNIFYNYCIKNGIAYFTELEQAELYERAKEIVIVYYSENGKSVFEKREFRDIILSIRSGKINSNVNTRILAEAKKLSIPKIYDKLIEQNINLADVIDLIEKLKNHH